MLIDIYMKFREDRLNGIQVVERTRFCDRQTDAREKKKTICLPTLKALKGDIYFIEYQENKQPRKIFERKMYAYTEMSEKWGLSHTNQEKSVRSYTFC